MRLIYKNNLKNMISDCLIVNFKLALMCFNHSSKCTNTLIVICPKKYFFDVDLKIMCSHDIFYGFSR